MQQRGQIDRLIGRRLGAYELQARLGAGGMGVVYRAVHHRLGQPRAIKVLPATFANDETFVERFEREAQLASELRHPNIVVIHDIAEDDGVNFIVMELVEGRTLREVIHQDGPLQPERAVQLLAQLADALDFAHQRGVVHRDIKPGNALVSPNDHLTLVDFGIARAAEGTRLTEAGARIGTAEYMAPESITEGESGPGTDLYALGVIAYETLTGRTPFTGVNSQAIMYAQIHNPPPSPRSVRPDLSAGIERVLVRQLGKDPAERYPSARAFVDALDEAIQTTRWIEESQRGSTPHEAGPDGSPSTRPGSTSQSQWQSQRRSAPASSGAAGAGAPGSGGVGAGAVGLGAVGAGTISQDAAAARDRLSGSARGDTDPRQTRSGPDSGTVSIPSPPGRGGAPTSDQAASESPAATREAPFSLATLFKLVVGGTVVVLLLMTFLPMPRDPLASDFSERLRAPQGMAGLAMLGTDDSGRDVLSRMIAGGRFTLIRLVVIGLMVVAPVLVLRRRRQAAGKRVLLTNRRLIMLTASILAVLIVVELAIALFGGLGPLTIERLQRLSIVGRVLFGVPPDSNAVTWGGMLVDGLKLGARAPWLVVFPAAALAVTAAGLGLLASGLVDLLKLRDRLAERRLQTSDTAILS
jgi:serine/threonine-protein kinase